jgi:hypothetical protein
MVKVSAAISVAILGLLWAYRWRSRYRYPDTTKALWRYLLGRTRT